MNDKKICKYCRTEIDRKAKICPNCKKKQSGLGDAFKAVIVAIALLIFVPPIIGACSKGADDTRPSSDSSTRVAATKEVTTTVPENGSTEIEDVTSNIEETEAATENVNTDSIIVYNQGGVKISYTGIEEKSNRMQIKFLIENDTDITYCVQQREFSVNGYMIDANMSAEVAPHKKTNDSISVYKSSLDENNIANLENAEFYFHIFDWNDWNNGFDTDVITLKIE